MLFPSSGPPTLDPHSINETTGRSKEKHFDALAALIPAVMRILCPFALPADALQMTVVADIQKLDWHEDPPDRRPTLAAAPTPKKYKSTGNCYHLSTRSIADRGKRVFFWPLW
jgi:hypothetical protein